MFDKLFTSIEAVVADVEAHNWGQLLTDFATVVADAAPIVGPFLTPKMGCSPEDEEKIAACKAKVEDCLARHDAKCATPVGKLFPGDGSVARAILQFFLTTILPLLIAKPVPAPAA